MEEQTEQNEWPDVFQLTEQRDKLLAVLEDIGKHAVANSHGSFNVSADRIREIRKIIAEYLPR